MAGVIVCYRRRAWAVTRRLAALSSFPVQSCAFLCLWPMKSMWSHWESVHLGKSASGTHHIEIILDRMPWGVISHLLTQWGFMAMTTETHSFVYRFCPSCGYENPFHLPYNPWTFHNQSPTWNNCSVNYTTFFIDKRVEGDILFCFKKIIWWAINRLCNSNYMK